MTTCANCKTSAVYSYRTTPYCNLHLPRFLRDRYGKPNNLVSKVVVEVPRATIDRSMIPAVLEPIAEPEVYPEVIEEVVEEVVEEAPKKKATPKAE